MDPENLSSTTAEAENFNRSFFRQNQALNILLTYLKRLIDSDRSLLLEIFNRCEII
jgi:hypothetical protein